VTITDSSIGSRQLDLRMMTAVDILPELRDDLLRYLFATSADRVRMIGVLMWRNRRMADLLIVLESDDELRTRFEMELLSRGGDAQPT
jgi:hypothetical protein